MQKIICIYGLYVCYQYRKVLFYKQICFRNYIYPLNSKTFKSLLDLFRFLFLEYVTCLLYNSKNKHFFLVYQSLICELLFNQPSIAIPDLFAFITFDQKDRHTFGHLARVGIRNKYNVLNLRDAFIVCFFFYDSNDFILYC